jgi:hypothetical protein
VVAFKVAGWHGEHVGDQFIGDHKSNGRRYPSADLEALR